MLKHVIDTARSLNMQGHATSNKICVIVGHGSDLVQAAVVADDIAFAKQEPQLGTGHAVAQAIPHLDDVVPTLILYGDVPLTKQLSLQRLVTAAGSDKLAILTAVVDDPTGLGRIVREDGKSAVSLNKKMQARPSGRFEKSTRASWSRRPPS